MIGRWWARLLRRVAPAIPGRTPVREAPFVVLDTETTGLNVDEDRLLAIAAVLVQDQTIHVGRSFEVVVAGDRVGASAAPIHGMVTADLLGGVTPEEAVRSFLDFAGDGILVAHHVAFDVAMLRRALAEVPGARIANRVLDTEALAQRLEHGPMTTADIVPRRSLDDLADDAGVPAIQRHSAAGDALTTAIVLVRLLSTAEKRGIRTVGDLLRRTAWSGG